MPCRAIVPLCFLVASSVACAGPNWVEPSSGAGSLPPTAGKPNGVGPLQLLSGSLEGPVIDGGKTLPDFEDVYEIFIENPSAFRARTFSSADGGGATFNTLLFLFDASGNGLLANDDAFPGEFGSELLPMSNDGTGVSITAPGVYYLAICGAGNRPRSPGGAIFNLVSPFEISGPDGPGGSLALSEWSGAGEFGEYTIALEGVRFIPRAVPGLTEHFHGTSIGGWGGGVAGSATYDNPGTNGASGAGDGYLRVQQSANAFFGAAEFDGTYEGNYLTNGVGGIVVHLNDIGAANNFEMHLGLGTPFVNFWTYNGPLIPANNAWSRHYVRIQPLNPAHWSRVAGFGSLEDALANATTLLLRHDLPPFMQFPDPKFGDLGIDLIRLTPICPGDTNGDGMVNFLDLNNVLSFFGQSGVGLPGDVNNDGQVNFPDLNGVLSFFGQSCPDE